MDITVADGAAVAVQIVMGISLAACAGLRAFLPLLVVGAAGRADWLPLSSSFEWLESWPALTVFGVAVVAELLGDKFPVVDNVLDVVQGLVKPVAGTIVMASVLTDLSPLQAAVVGLVLGGSSAGAVHVTKAKLRLLSSATTAGVANPVISISEDVGAVAGSLLALVAPLLVLLAFATGLIVVWWLFRRMWRAGADVLA